MRTPSLVALTLTLAWSTIAAAAPQLVAVTTCGQLVPRGATGYLTGNLDCTATPDAPAVMVDRNARLDLRGFTITGGRFGVWCGSDYNVESSIGGKCQIIGAGGTIENANLAGVVAVGVVASNLTVRNSVHDGIEAHTAKLGNVTLTGNGGNGASTFRDLKVTASTVSDNGFVGLRSLQRRVKVVDSTVVDNGTDPQCGPFSCADLSSPRRPSVKGTVCEYSVKPALNLETWGVCALD
jgi:hypothetical protein